MSSKERGERQRIPEGIATANLQFKFAPESVPWIYASVKNAPQVSLFDGEFPDPFRRLKYGAAYAQNQLTLAATLDLGEEFIERYGAGIGRKEDLAPLTKRYPKHEFLSDQQLIVARDGNIEGVISRIAGDKILIQRGGPAGQINLSEATPTNDLAIILSQFNLLLQRYISAIWKASFETDQQQMQLVLDLPSAPEGVANTYFSTFEIIRKQFDERPRTVDLNEDIGGYPGIKAIMKSLVLDITDPDVSRSFGTQPISNKFVLAVGGEGTGKSLYPKALDVMLRKSLGNNIEHFRLPFANMLLQYGTRTAMVLETVLAHVRENERQGIPTLVHFDNLEHLIPIQQRREDIFVGPSAAELNWSLQTINPILLVLRDFGREVGAQSGSVIVYGESRVPRDTLPETVSRTFRRAFNLDDPTANDLADILRVQVGITRGNAEQTGYDPFVSDVVSSAKLIVKDAVGLNGRDIQQALINITTNKKADWDGKTRLPITKEEISRELQNIRLSKGIEGVSKGRLGFRTNESS